MAFGRGGDRPWRGGRRPHLDVEVTVIDDDDGEGPSKLSRILNKLEHIMATQQEHAAALNTLRDQLVKVGGETESLIKAVADLTAAVAAAGNTTAEVDAAMQAVTDQANAVDALVADAVVPTP